MLAMSKERGEQWRIKESSPERNKVWIEAKTSRRVGVVYYLSRNGKLEQPHFMELTLSSNEGLFLRDVLNRLNVLRGRAVPKMYSWSSKRSYKNGFVWHDLCEEDFIYPVRGNEYVLKGTEIINLSLSSLSFQSSTTSSENNPQYIQRSVRDDALPAVATRKKTCRRSAFDTDEFRGYKTKSKSNEFPFNSTNASTQTERKAHRKKTGHLRNGKNEFSTNIDTSSSLKSLKTVSVKPEAEYNATGSSSSAQFRASALLMHLLSCASGCETKEERLSSTPLGYNTDQRRMPNSTTNHEEKENLDDVSSFQCMRLEDREYYSCSLMENSKMNRDDVGEDLRCLKRSSSFNAYRSSRIDELAKEVGIYMPKKSNTMINENENHFVSLSCIRHG